MLREVSQSHILIDSIRFVEGSNPQRLKIEWRLLGAGGVEQVIRV